MTQEHAKAGETVDTLYGGQVRLNQRKDGYRFTGDALLLAHSALQSKGKIIDLGTGCGVIPVILGRFGAAESIIGLEIQDELCDIAQRNIEGNGLGGKITILRGDLKDVKRLFPAQSFDHVLSNPPYLPMGAARVNPVREKAVAKHEILCSTEDIVEAARHLLRERGVLRLIYPNSRLVDLVLNLRKRGVEPKRFRFVHDRADGPSKVCLVEAAKGAKAQSEIGPPLILRDNEGLPTPEYIRIFGSPDPIP
jgi:tRNA1Val (adenine37-N6)-methyltransferase